MHQFRLAGTLCLCLLVLAAGCASDIEFGTTYDPLTPFPARATFVWDQRANVLPEAERLRSLDLGGIVEKVASEEFAARGYSRADAPPSDFLLSYQISVHTWSGASESFALGSLSLLLVDAGSNRRVWTGFGRAEFDIALSHEQREERLRSAVRTMLEDFPPSQPKD